MLTVAPVPVNVHRVRCHERTLGLLNWTRQYNGSVGSLLQALQAGRTVIPPHALGAFVCSKRLSAARGESVLYAFTSRTLDSLPVVDCELTKWSDERRDMLANGGRGLQFQMSKQKKQRFLHSGTPSQADRSLFLAMTA